MLSLFLALSILPFNPDYSIKGCTDSQIIVLDEFQTILEYSNQIPEIFEIGSVKLRGLISPTCNRINARVTVNFDINKNGKITNYKVIDSLPKRVADREVKKAIYRGKINESVYGLKSVQITVHYLQYQTHG
jgi:TonB family protein